MGSDDSLSTDPTDIILFMFFGLVLGIIVMQLLNLCGDPIPYTVVIFALGVVFSLDNVFKSDDLGMWGNSIERWSRIDAELILFVFLPPLIFGEAMSLNWFFLTGGFVQALILAGPGVLIGAALMAAAAKGIIPHSWSWELSFVFGSILSATDPVAVVALLKDAGASPKLTILIVGESLLNDGTAMVLFTLFFNMLKGETYTGGDIVGFFFSACLGSPLFGVACGLIMVRWLRTCNRSLKEIDTVIQICITICCAYLIFFIAQNPLEISGVLACCGAGAMLAWLAPPLILNHESMHNVWGIIEWMGNTLIFLLAGLIIGTRTLKHVALVDFGLMFLLYVILMAIRFIVIFVLYPWISTIGHKCTRNEAVFMSWAGLRGALSMSLALIVEKQGDQSDEKDQSSRLFFYVGGIATLTLLINATTAQKVLLKLGLMGEDSIEQDIIMTHIRKRLRKKISKMINAMEKELEPDVVEEIRQSCSLLRASDAVDIAGMMSINTEDVLIHTLAASDQPQQQPQPPHRRGSGRLRGYSAVFTGAGGGVGAGQPAITRQRSTSSASQGSFGGIRTKSAEHAIEQRWGSRAHSVAQVVTLSKNRSSVDMIIQELMSYVRTVFLEIVRVSYWHDIDSGKLPRLSHSAQFLLYSVDVGLDNLKHAFLQDWACIERELDSPSIFIRILSAMEQYSFGRVIPKILGRLEARREKRAVYMLTSFIDAHTRAQQKMHSYLGLEDEDEDDSPTPEELKVKAESVALVELAKRRLDAMSPGTVSAIKSKQTARMVLSKQADMVKEMVKEGLLSEKHAAEFLEEIGQDTDKIERARNLMYRAHASDAAVKRAQRYDDTRESSLFSTILRPSMPGIEEGLERRNTNTGWEEAAGEPLLESM